LKAKAQQYKRERKNSVRVGTDIVEVVGVAKIRTRGKEDYEKDQPSKNESSKRIVSP
jgi:hypothetical protein